MLLLIPNEQSDTIEFFPYQQCPQPDTTNMSIQLYTIHHYIHQLPFICHLDFEQGSTKNLISFLIFRNKIEFNKHDLTRLKKKLDSQIIKKHYPFKQLLLK